MGKILVTAVFASFLAFGGTAVNKADATQGETSWEGTYTFEEVAKRGGGNAGDMSYEILIHRDGNKLVADLNVEGWQTSDRLKCETKIEGNKIHLYLRGFGEDDFSGKVKYKIGTLLLTLQKSIVAGKTRILTYWGAFKPISKANALSGKVYFKR